MCGAGEQGGLKAAWWEGVDVSAVCMPRATREVLAGQSLGLLCPKVRGEKK